MEAIRALLKQITAFWGGKDARFKRNVIIIASSALVVIILLSILLNQVPYSTLYSGLNTEDSAAVLQALDDQKEPYKVQGDTIQVPAKDVDRLRISLSTEVKNTFNLDILKQGQGLGMTESDKQDFRKYQLENDLRQAIMTVKGVKNARVLLTIPDESAFVITSDRQYSTASLLLELEPGAQFDQEQIDAIYGFVQKAVPGLTTDNISIMDGNMQSLDLKQADDFSTAGDQLTLQKQVADKLRKQVMTLLVPIFGMGKVEAQVNVVLNFDDTTVDSKTFTPVVDSKGIEISSDKLREQIENGADTGTEPGVDPNTGTPTYPTVSGSNGTYEKTEDKVNLEVNSVYKHIQEAKGKIENLSVSVVVDNTNLKTDLTDNVRNLVKNAVGAEPANISVEYMPMQGSQDMAAAIQLENEQRAESLKFQQGLPLIIIGSVLLAGLIGLLLMFLYNKARRAALAPQPVMYAAPQGDMLDEDQEDDKHKPIDIVKDSDAKEEIGKLIEHSPELVANLLRSWLADDQE